MANSNFAQTHNFYAGVAAKILANAGEDVAHKYLDAVIRYDYKGSDEAEAVNFCLDVMVTAKAIAFGH